MIGLTVSSTRQDGKPCWNVPICILRKKDILESNIPLSHQEALENRSRVDSENIDKKEDEDEDTKEVNVLRIQLLFDKLLL